jgi:hypothetical protein
MLINRRIYTMHEFDDAVLQCFLDNQLQLFPEKVAESLEEAEDFLEECMAVVVGSKNEVLDFFEEEGLDLEGADEDGILEADEVFDIGDGRYLIIEG